MPKILLLLAPGFEEIEAVTLIDVLRRAEITVTVAGLDATPVRGSHDIEVNAECLLDDVEGEDYDGIVLPGGMPGAANLAKDPRVRQLLVELSSAGKLVSAICAAPTVLEAAGLLRGRRATGYPGFLLPSAEYVEEAVVEDGNLVTSRGPGTSLALALSLVGRLVGPERAQELAARMLVSGG
ncbi:MAG: DJ-1/PfpI family protein [Myxococcales bacterium]|nr:DJ-1/PfpI family protein [Myxococcales bacterium]